MEIILIATDEQMVALLVVGLNPLYSVEIILIKMNFEEIWKKEEPGSVSKVRNNL